jgi:hypothetical protein
LEATRTAVLDDGGYEVRLTAGVSRVREDHPIVTAHPDYFRPASGGVRLANGERAYSSTGAALEVALPDDVVRTHAEAPLKRSDVRFVSERRYLKPGRIIAGSETVALRHDAKPAGSFRLASDARDQIADEIARGGGDETGGALLGSSDRQLIDVVRVTGPGNGAKRSRGALTFDADYLSQEIAAAEADGLRLIGIWHSHPRAAVNHLPSAADLRFFDGLRGDDPVFGALIAVPTMEGDDWTLSGWRITRGACLPMRVPEGQ